MGNLLVASVISFKKLAPFRQCINGINDNHVVVVKLPLYRGQLDETVKHRLIETQSEKIEILHIY